MKISDTPLMLFDGECALCDGAVQFVLDHEREGVLKFAPLQSECGQSYLDYFDLPLNDWESFVIVEGDRCYTKSSAAARLGHHIGGPWRWLGQASRIVPRFIADSIYDYVFRNRIRWFGRVDSCRLANASTEHRFLTH